MEAALWCAKITSMQLPTSLRYQRPDFAVFDLTQLDYEKWLHRRAVAHVRRDKKRGNATATIAGYKAAIHRAVISSEGCDFYTGELLKWALAGTHRNEHWPEQKDRRRYRLDMALAPSVDHVGDGLGAADFRICGWRTNDAKSDSPHGEFVAFCRLVVEHDQHSAKPPE